jgi:hypothetical protein
MATRAARPFLEFIIAPLLHLDSHQMPVEFWFRPVAAGVPERGVRSPTRRRSAQASLLSETRWYRTVGRWRTVRVRFAPD